MTVNRMMRVNAYLIRLGIMAKFSIFKIYNALNIFLYSGYDIFFEMRDFVEANHITRELSTTGHLSLQPIILIEFFSSILREASIIQ